MKTRELEYDLPPELIVQHPVARHDESRLLIPRVSKRVHERRFADLPDVIGDALVVVNDTRVVPARIPIEAPRGEVLLLERWTRRALGRPGTTDTAAAARPPLRAGRAARAPRRTPLASPAARRAGGRDAAAAVHHRAARRSGALPDVYARDAGSAAAPTAGLHFTEEVLARLEVERVTLHVGLDRFRPVAAEDLGEHHLHGERYEVRPDAWERIRAVPSVLAVGTTTVRVLETLARGGPLSGRTDLFVTPGFEFLRTDALLTNFHLPRSTLLALVMACAGVEETRRLYRTAVEQRYRFYSFGDAMLVL